MAVTINVRRKRVVVKFRPDVELPYSVEADARVSELLGSDWTYLKAAYPGIRLGPYFSTLGEPVLRNLIQRKPFVQGGPMPAPFTLYYTVHCPVGVEPHRVAQAISSWPAVEVAYVEGGPVPQPASPQS